MKIRKGRERGKRGSIEKLKGGKGLRKARKERGRAMGGEESKEREDRNEERRKG